MSAAIAELEAQRQNLDLRVNDLRGFEREYRGRLREHLTSLLDDLNYCDEVPIARQEIISAAWSLIVPGWEIRANGGGVYDRVCIEIRRAE